MPTIALNAKLKAPSQFTNFQYNSYVNFNNECIGFNSSGIYRILQTGSDNTEEINCIIASVNTDFGIGADKRLVALYIGFTADSDFEVDVYINDEFKGTYTIRATTSGKQTYRVVTGRGSYGRYFGFEFRNINGSYVILDSFDALIKIIDKRHS